jgi:glycosyltransferase involved in cell wall biosynthesis
MKLLLLSYFYPPHQGIGGKRVFRWARHLSALGVSPVVLTTPWPPAKDRDLDQPFTAPGVEVAREYVSAWFWRLYHGKHGGEYAPGRVAKALNTIGRLLGTPIDSKLWFAPRAARQGLSLVRRRGIGAVLSSSSPYSSHVAATWISILADIPLVVDLRDPWTFNFLWRNRPRLMRALDGWTERWVLSRAARVIFAARGTQSEYERRYPWLRGKSLTLYSGFEPDEPGAPVAAWPGERPRVGLVHFGRFYGVRSLRDTLRALSEAKRESSWGLRDLSLLILGDVSARDKEEAGELGVAEHLQSSPMMPYEAGLGVLRGADALFLCDYDRESFFVPGKLFDYVRVGRPILAVSANPEVREIIAGHGLGLTFHPDDTAGLAACLSRISTHGAEEALQFSPRGVDALRAESSARRLAEELRAVTGTRRDHNER